jgi:hypothetical protein
MSLNFAELHILQLFIKFSCFVVNQCLKLVEAKKYDNQGIPWFDELGPHPASLIRTQAA